MAIDLRWWDEEHLLEYRCSGDVDGPELLAANRAALADERFPSVRTQLCDMRWVSSFEISREEIRDIVELDLRASDLAPGCDRVAIVAEDDLIYGFARMYELTLDGRVPGWEVGVFRERAEAVAWLEVPDPDPHPAP